jgi:hypothetical protein
VKRTESIREETSQQAISSTNLINDRNTPNPLLGIQHDPATTPTTSHLQSIQELSSEHYNRFDNQSASSNARLGSDLVLFQDGNFGSSKHLTNSGRQGMMDPNDGKSSPEMMNMLRSLTSHRQ